MRFTPIARRDARKINAAQKFARSRGPAARPFLSIPRSTDANRAEDCLASAAFFEAGDGAEGERAVAQVVLNRVRHPAFPKTVCGVVFQGSERHTGCQFTFTCDGTLSRRAPSPAAWRRARAIAAAALGGAVFAPVGLATHYHADWMVPYWSAKLDKVVQIGPHIFYRWAGWWGTPGAYSGRERGAEPAVGMLHDLDTSRVIASTLLLDGTMVVHGRTHPFLSAPSDPDLFLIHLDGSSSEYPTRAQALCVGHDRCTVLGWTSPRLVAKSLPLTPEQMSGLEFRYGRSAESAPAVVRWDCQRTPRYEAKECLRGGTLLGKPQDDTPPAIGYEVGSVRSGVAP